MGNRIIYRMKKFLGFVLVIILIVGAVFCLRKPVSPKRAASQVAVVTSGYVPYILVREISGGRITPEMLLAPGAEPHSFEPSPGSLIAVHNAQAFFYVSPTLEPWVKDVLGAAGENTRVVALADAVIPTDDPHVWMDFDNVVKMAQLVQETLSQLDPKNASLYAENFTRFSQEISALDGDFKQVLLSCENREIIHIGHLAFGALAKRYNLALTALAGSSHDGEHSAKRLTELVKHIRAANVKALFTEDAVSPRLAQTVAVETGAQLLPLYTIEDISKDDFKRGVTYQELMHRNLASLQEGLTCQK